MIRHLLEGELVFQRVSKDRFGAIISRDQDKAAWRIRKDIKIRLAGILSSFVLLYTLADGSS
jgi:hypothetical protein